MVAGTHTDNYYQQAYENELTDTVMVVAFVKQSRPRLYAGPFNTELVSLQFDGRSAWSRDLESDLLDYYQCSARTYALVARSVHDRTVPL